VFPGILRVMQRLLSIVVAVPAAIVAAGFTMLTLRPFVPYDTVWVVPVIPILFGGLVAICVAVWCMRAIGPSRSTTPTEKTHPLDAD